MPLPETQGMLIIYAQSDIGRGVRINSCTMRPEWKMGLMSTESPGGQPNTVVCTEPRASQWQHINTSHIWNGASKVSLISWLCSVSLKIFLGHWVWLYNERGNHQLYIICLILRTVVLWLVKWVHMPRLIWWKFFPDDRLEGFVCEIQHFPIWVHLQAAAFRWGWRRLTEGGL